MRELIEEAAITYRQEAENLLFVSAPAAVCGPVLVLISTAGRNAALVAVPLLLIVYLAAYAASVRATGRMLNNMEPEPVSSYLGALLRGAGVLRAAAPGGVLLFGVWWCAILISDQGFAPIALLLGLAGGGVAFAWAAQHAYDLPLVLVHDVQADEAAELGPQLVGPKQTTRLAGIVSLPLLAVGLLCLAIGAANPAFGGVLFAIAIGLWLPFAAIVFTSSCDRIVAEALSSDGYATRAAS